LLSALRSPLSALRSPLSALRSPLITGTAQAQNQGQSSRWWDQNRTTPPPPPTEPAKTTPPPPPTEPAKTTPSTPSQTASQSSTSQTTATSPGRDPNSPRQGPSYTWIQADFIKQDVPYHYKDLDVDKYEYDEVLDEEFGYAQKSEDIDGFRLSGSIALNQHIYLTALYSQISYKRMRFYDEPNYYEDELSTVDISQLRLGIGAHWPIFTHTDFILEGGVLYSWRTQKGVFYSYDVILDKEEEEVIDDRRSSGGSYLNVGWRTRPIDPVELFQELRWFSVGSEGGRRAASIAHGIQYFIVPNFAISVGIEVGEKDMLDYEAGLRLRF